MQRKEDRQFNSASEVERDYTITKIIEHSAIITKGETATLIRKYYDMDVRVVRLKNKYYAVVDSNNIIRAKGNNCKLMLYNFMKRN